MQSLVAKCYKMTKNIALRSLQILYILGITRGKSYHLLAEIAAKMVTFSARDTNMYKICKLSKPIFSLFYNILPPNSAILLIFGSGCNKRFCSFCLDRMLVHYANCSLS